MARNVMPERGRRKKEWGERGVGSEAQSLALPTPHSLLLATAYTFASDGSSYGCRTSAPASRTIPFITVE